MRDLLVASMSRAVGGCVFHVGVVGLPQSTLAPSSAGSGTGFTPQSFAKCRNRLTLANTPLAAFARASISFSSSAVSASNPLAVRAHPTSLDSSTRTSFLSFAKTGNDVSTVLSLLRQSVCMRAERMEEMTQAVEG